MAKVKMIGWIVTILGGVLGVALGLFLEYHIQFTWKFFGANMITLGSIIGVWLIPTLLLGYAGLYVGGTIGEKL